MSEAAGAKLRLLIAMAIYGTVGMMFRWIPLPSTVVSMFRGLLGALTLLTFKLVTRKKIDFRAIRNNLALLLISGLALSGNWIFLFGSYSYTTIAVASVCDYLAPIFIILAAPFILKEKMTAKKLFCVIVAFIGLVLVSGLLHTAAAGDKNWIGVLMSSVGAVFYAILVFANKKLHDIDTYDRTIVQFAVVVVIMTIYNAVTVDLGSLTFTGATVPLLLVIGVVHSGFAYALYFGSMQCLPVSTVSILSYVEPVVGVLCSFFILKEPADVYTLLGCILIIGAAVASEIRPFSAERKVCG